MIKLAAIQIHTPKNRLFPRTRSESVIYTKVASVREAAEQVLPHFLQNHRITETTEIRIGGRLYATCSTAFVVLADTPSFEIIINEASGEYAYEVTKMGDEYTQLTDENIIEWAKKHAEKNPTRGVEPLDNSPELALAEVLYKYYKDVFGTYNSSDMLLRIMNMFWNGQKAYKDMTMPELIEEIYSIADNMGAETIEEIPYMK